MSRYERSRYLETLCSLRAWYLSAPPDDRRGTLSIDDAIIYAEAVMDTLAAEGHDLPADAIDVEDLPASISDPRD